MKITEVTVNLSAVIPTGSYQNYKPMYEVKGQLEEGDSALMALQQGRDIVRRMFVQDWTRLREKDKTEYLNKCRFYEEKGKKYPSVTSIIGWSELLYRLRNPDKFQFGGVEEDELAEYAARGTIVHRGVQQWFTDTKGGTNIPPDYKVTNVFSDLVVEQTLLAESKLSVESCNWLGFWAKYGEKFKLTKSEKKVVSQKFGYAGRFDLYGTYENKPAIIDIKTSSSYPERKKLMYFKQLSAYANALFGVKRPEKLVIIPLNPSNKSGFGEPIIADNSENLFNSFRKDLSQFQADFKDLI